MVISVKWNIKLVILLTIVFLVYGKSLSERNIADAVIGCLWWQQEE